MVVLIAIIYLTLFPQPLGENEVHLFEGADKIVHFIMFGGLTGTFIFDRWRIGQPLGMGAAILAATASAVIGAVAEYLQYVMQLGRSGNDIFDILANNLGAFAAVPVCRWLHWIHIVVDSRS